MIQFTQWCDLLGQDRIAKGTTCHWHLTKPAPPLPDLFSFWKNRWN
jgi:hypothetical protein